MQDWPPRGSTPAVFSYTVGIIISPAALVEQFLEGSVSVGGGVGVSV